jgi:hypothetical protein
MRSVLAVAIVAAMSLCGFVEKLKQSGGSAPAKPSEAEAPSNSGQAQKAKDQARSTPTPDIADDIDPPLRDPLSDDPLVVSDDSVLAKLLALEKKLCDAAVDHNMAVLADNSTDDFVFTDIDDKVRDKKGTLAAIKQASGVRSLSVENAKLEYSDNDSASINYVLVATPANGKSVRFRGLDTFENINGRWLIRSQRLFSQK